MLAWTPTVPGCAVFQELGARRARIAACRRAPIFGIHPRVRRWVIGLCYGCDGHEDIISIHHAGIKVINGAITTRRIKGGLNHQNGWAAGIETRLGEFMILIDATP